MNTININRPTNKKFGFSFIIIFIIVAFYFFYIENFLFSKIFILIASILLIMTMFFSNLLTFFNDKWMEFGTFLGKITNPLIMGILFFIIISPIAIFFKIIKRDELNIKIKNEKSFFVIKHNHVNTIDTLKNQF